MIQIQGLSPLQKELCDKIWSMETQEEVVSWINTLPRSVAFQAYVMMQMIVQAALDEEDLNDMPEARAVIDHVMSLK
jgi:hypothetical protein